MVSAIENAAASSKLEVTFRRVFSITVVASSSEVVINAFRQELYLNRLSWVLLIAFVFSVLAPTASSFFGRAKKEWFLLHGAVTMGIVLLWPWLVDENVQMPSDFQPWIWWGVGMAAISVGTMVSTRIALTYLTANSVLWFFLDTSSHAGYSDPWVSLQDSVYIFFFSGAVIGLIGLVRDGARRVDEANSLAILATSTKAQREATDRERSNLDALVHDHILNAFSIAMKAQTPQERQTASHLAAQALVALAEARETEFQEPPVSSLELFKALRKAAIGVAPHVRISPFDGVGDMAIPGPVARAFTGAAMQALDNAYKHARAKNIWLKVKAHEAGEFQIEVADDGRGFDAKRVPADRAGIANSIVARVKSVEGVGTIQSTPGSGTTVTLRWFR